MFSLSWERDGGKGISVKTWSCSLVFQAPNPSGHILLQGVIRHKAFGRAMAVREGSSPSCGFSWNKLIWEEKRPLVLGNVQWHRDVTSSSPEISVGTKTMETFCPVMALVVERH